MKLKEVSDAPTDAQLVLASTSEVALDAEVLVNRPIIIASNRGPVTAQATMGGEVEFQRGGGGLVTALLGLCKYSDATWIACAQTNEDASWSGNSVPFENGASIRAQFLNPEPSAYEGYYNVISNPLLWFLQHCMWDLPRMPVIRQDTWRAWKDGYVAVNRLFAQAVAEHVRAKSRPPLVMLQDYHLYLAARFLKDTLRRPVMPTTLHFTHIPWPGPDYWAILPPTMRNAILDGLCAVDIAGFQTHEDSLNFLRTCEMHLIGTRVNYKRRRVWYRNHATHVRDFPISIDVRALREAASSDETRRYREDFAKLVGDDSLILRIDRIDPSKNIIRGFAAFEEMLALYPEHRGKVRLLALLVPSRLEVGEYQDYLGEIMAAGGHVNARFGTSQWEPVRILVGDSYHRAVAAMQMYDVLLVNSIADGMNLVAKEGPIVNERSGALVLSERAGAQQQLGLGALVISPCDVYATAEALHQSLVMPMSEREVRASRLRTLIEREDITDWLHKQLRAIKELGL